MASSKYVEEIQRGVESLINCLICTDKYTNPKILPCQHTFCLPCLEKFYESYTSQRIIRTSNFPCPQCRKNVYIPAGGMDSLPSDFKVGQIQEVFERINFSMVNKEVVICDVCRYDYRKSPAQGFCAQCAKYLCEKCSEQHSGNVLFQGHFLIAIGTHSAKTLICPDHQEEIKYYCSNCRIALCTVCALGKHSKHETLSLSDALDKQRLALQKHVDNLRQNLIQHEGKAQQLANLHGQQSTNLQEMKDHIKRHALACITRVKEDEARLLKELDKSKDKGSTDLEGEISVINIAVSGIKEALVAAEDLLSNSNSLDSISQFEKLDSYFTNNCTPPSTSIPESLHNQFKLLPKTDLNIGHIKVTTNKPKVGEQQVASTSLPLPKGKTAKSEKLNTSARSSFTKDKSSNSSTPKQSPNSSKLELVLKPSESPKSTDNSIDDAVTTSGFDKPLRSSTPVSKSSNEQLTSSSSEGISTQKPANEKNASKTAEGSSLSESTQKETNESPKASPESATKESDTAQNPGTTGTSRFQIRKSESSESSKANSVASSAASSRASSVEKQKLGLSDGPSAKTSSTTATNAQNSGKSTGSSAQSTLKDTKLLWKTMDRPEARDADFLPDGSLVVTEYRPSSDKLQVFDVSGNLKCSVTCSAQNIIRPWGVAVNQQNGYMVVTDHGDRAVKVLDPELSMRSVWRSVFNKPSGVCVMRNGDFAVTDTGKHVGMISIHTQSGICKRDFCNKGADSGECKHPSYIAADHNDRLIVADSDLHCIKIFDSKGKQLLKFCAADHPPMNPQGIAVDSHNNILVADQGLNTVSLYSPEGRFVQHLAQLKDSPYGIGIHSSGILAIATDPSVQVFNVPALKV